MTDDLMAHVRATVAAMPLASVRGTLADLIDPDKMPQSALDRLTEREARDLLAELAYDADDAAGTRQHCALLARV